MAVQRDLTALPIRRTTLLLALLVAAYVPIMQIVMDHAAPQMTKPVLAGGLSGLIIASLCWLPRRWNLNLLFMSIMGLLTLGLAEFICGMVLPPTSASIYEWDDQTIYRTRPNSQKRYRRTTLNGGQVSDVTINSLGYRGPEIPTQSSEPTVIVYGDSFIEAEYSQFEQTFCEQVRQNLEQQTSRPIRVINAGTNGFGPDQVLLRMERELPRLKPQLVVLSVFADNDYGDLLRNKLFRLDAAGNLVASQWQRSADCLHPGMRGRYEPVLWKLGRNTLRALQSRGGLVESYMDRWLQQCLAEYDEYVVRQDSVVHDLQSDHYDADISLTPGSPSGDYKRRLFASILQRIHKLCEQHQTKLVVMVIPSAGDIVDGYDFCQIDHQRYPLYQPRALTDLAAQAAKQQKLPVVNLFAPFTQSKPHELYFRGGDNHWNDAGQKLAAELVAPVVADLLK